MYFIITLNQWVFSLCWPLAVYVNTLLNQGLFWQKPWSLHTSKSEALPLGKCTGFICNGEACAKYTFLLIQGEKEPTPCSKLCRSGLFWGCFARCMGCYSHSWILLSGLHFNSGDMQTTTVLAVCAALVLQGHVLWVLSLKDSKKDWNDSSSVGLALSSE